MPAVAPITDMQRRGAALADQAIASKEPIYLTRHGKAAVVLIDAAEYDRRMRYRDAIVEREQQAYAGIMQGHAELAEGRGIPLADALAAIDERLAP